MNLCCFDFNLSKENRKKNYLLNFIRNWGGFEGLIPNGDGDGESPIIFIGDWREDAKMGRKMDLKMEN